MHEVLAVAVFTQKTTLYEKLVSCVQEFVDRVAQFTYHDRIDSLQDFARDASLIVILDMTQERDLCLRWIRRTSDACPDSVSVCLQGEFGQTSTLEAVRAGARDFLSVEPTTDEILAMVKRLKGTMTRTQSPSRVLGVLGVVGGSGASTLAVNLAAEMAKIDDSRVGILGLTSVGSGPELLLNLHPNVTLFDLWEHVEELDSLLVDRAAARHPSGVALVSAQDWPLEHLPIPGKIVRRAIVLMQELFSYVGLDLPRGFPPAVLTGLEHSEAVLLVSPYSLAAADGAAQTLRALDSLAYPQNKVFWVANAVSESQPLTLRQLCRVMPTKPLATIPFGATTVHQAAVNGVCWADADARAGVTKAVSQLAGMMCRLLHCPGREEPKRVTPRQRLLSKAGYGA